MDVNLHQQQGINILNRMLDYAAFVAEDGHAQVHLTPEDWYVVADTLFQMDTPDEALPESIKSYRLINSDHTIEFTADEYVIKLEMIG